MGKPQHRYVAKAEPGRGWRVWDRKLARWWGEWRTEYPEAVLHELNRSARPEALVQVCKNEVTAIPRRLVWRKPGASVSMAHHRGCKPARATVTCWRSVHFN